MTNDDLAAEAATWVPPWQRPAPQPDPAGTKPEEPGPTETEPTETRAADEDHEASPELPIGGAEEATRVDRSEAGRDDPNEADDADADGDLIDAGPDADGPSRPGHAEPVLKPVESGEAGAGEAAPADAALPKQWAGLAGVQWRAQGPEADASAEAGRAAPDTLAPESETPRPRAPEADASAEAGGAVPDTLAPESEAAVAAEAELAVAPPGLAEGELVPALEAILMVVDEPVSEITLAQVLDVTAEQVANALIDLSAAYTRDGRGFDLRRAAGGWRFYTRADYSAYVEKFVLDGQQLRLTQASLETLAVVAYKQPVTRSRISAIRGVNCDGVIRTLVTRGMIEECGTDPDSGAHLYRTTTLFLEKLGLDSVDQLPPLAPFLPDNLDEVAND